ncbi:hypothetical protein [Actinoplanes subtropicus]|uniref:hypothetical protein n=1 Tax=Actinoplanes subtropicus TaxID=543632 RepID=UPI0004C2D4EE|nr:hypothetical protein [Actinoplanes subtropicus]
MRTIFLRALQVTAVVVVATAGWHACRAPAVATNLVKKVVLGPAGIARVRHGLPATGTISYRPVGPPASDQRNCAVLRTYRLTVVRTPGAEPRLRCTAAR